MSNFYLRLLGSAEIEIESDNKPIASFRSKRVLAVLAYLVVNKKAVSRSHLVDLIWPDKNEENGRGNLRWALSQLKKLLPDAIITTRKTAQFSLPDGCAVDLYALSDALESTADTFPIEVVDAVRGEFLDGFFFEYSAEYEMWLISIRETIRQQAAAIFSHAADHAASLGKADSALKIIDQWLDYDSWNETAYRFKMELLTRSGKPEEAINCYKQLETKLRQELDAAPSLDTELLYNNLVRRTTVSIKNNLPPQPTRFIGRSIEGAKLTHLLQRDEVRLISVIGSGGMGKTRIIVETAGQMLSHYLDGVVFVPLAGIDDVALVPNEVLEKCIQTGVVPTRRGVEPISYLQEALHNKEALLLLDNFEHLMDVTSFVVSLLNRCPQLTILVSSRERLNVRWERIVRMGGLTIPDAEQLFTQMAEHANPSFRVNNQNRPHIHRICELVEGMPLALELAASWSHVQSCEEIAKAIENSLNVLSVTQRDRPDRHLSVRASFDYSWQLLSEKEQAVLKKLAVFPGSFTVEAAQAIADVDLPTLAALLDKSLLQQETRGESKRYHMHELLRQFLSEQTATEDLSELLNQFCEFYALVLNHNQDGIMKGSADALNLIEVELPNIRRAWMWMMNQQKLQWILGSFQPYAYFYDMRCLWQEGHDLYERMEASLFKSFEADKNDLAVMMALAGVMVSRANFLSRLGRVAQAEVLLYQSLDMLEPLHNAQGEAFIKFTLGRIASQTHRYEQAESYYHESYELAKSVNDIPGMARSWVNLANNFNKLGRYEDAAEYATSARALFEECGDQRGIAIAQGNLGVHAAVNNDSDACIRYAQAVKSSAIEVGSASLMIFHHYLIALSQFLTDNMESASRTLEAASLEAHNLGNIDAAIEHESSRVQTLLRCGRFEEAALLSNQIWQSSKTTDSLPAQIRSEISRGSVLQQAGDLEQAKAHLLTALKLARSNAFTLLTLDSAVCLSNYYLISDQPNLAEEIAAHIHDHPQSNAILRKLLFIQNETIDFNRSFDTRRSLDTLLTDLLATA